jgi:hypothetical protein
MAINAMAPPPLLLPPPLLVLEPLLVALVPLVVDPLVVLSLAELAPGLLEGFVGVPMLPELPELPLWGELWSVPEVPL